MADVNVNAPAEQAPAIAPPTRTDDQILPRIRWCLCQLNEQWFDLTKDTLRDALQITPVDTNNPFSSPPTPDALIKFVNDLGYPKVVRHLSDVVTNDMFQPWRTLTTIIILCLTGKTSGFERPRAPMLQILWGIVNRAHIDYAERMFTKLIIYYLQSKHNFDSRPGSPLHLPNEEPVLGYLKYLAGEEISDPDSPAPKPAKATKPKAAKQSKPLAPKPAPQTKKSSLQLVDDFVDEGVPENEPRVGDEEADQQKAVEESLKEFYSARQGPLPPVTSKKKSPADHETDSDEEVPRIVGGVQDEGQAGPNPGEHDKGQARPNPDDAEASQPLSSHVVHAGPNLEHMDLEASDTSIQPNPEQMDEEFTTMAYPNVQENLKRPTEGEVRLEEPASSAGTLSSLQNLDKELSFADQFLVEKLQEDEPEKTNTESKVQSMVTVPIHQDTSSVPLMTTPVIDLTVSQPVPTACIRELEQHMADMVSKAVDEIVTDAVDWAIQAPLRDRFKDLP
ncbi:hypothetical protein Tco_0340719 [Tanacetum coccineum]